MRFGFIASRTLSIESQWPSVDTIEAAFGADVDYGRIVKFYETDPAGPGRYSPPKVTSVERTVVQGEPRRISTSYVARSHLWMRMSLRQFTRLTKGFSKKMENYRKAVALYFTYYNFIRKHLTLKTTPAVAAGVTYRPWTVRDLLEWGWE